MSYDSKSIIKDVNGKPVPQYWNPVTEKYEVIESENNILRVNVVDTNGESVDYQNLVNQITAEVGDLAEIVKPISPSYIFERIEEKLDELIEVVK